MSDISSQLIKDSYNYVLQSDLNTGIIYRIGGGVPTNPIFQSGLTINSGFTYNNGTEQSGYVLTSDDFGNATWNPVSFPLIENYLPLSGGTVTGATQFTSGLTANTISATTYQNLPVDVFVTGGTYSNGVTTFTNNIGGTFNVTGMTIPSLLVSDGSITVTPVTGITFSGVTIIDNGDGNIEIVTGTIRRNDMVGNINYCGFAITGSLESDPVWTITVITVSLDGSVTSVVYYDVAWTDRYIL